MSFLAGFTSGGGVTGGDQTATSSNRDVSAATGAKNINIGGNPNVQSALASPWVVGAIVVLGAVYLWRRRK